jgi:hypothetical protein
MVRLRARRGLGSTRYHATQFVADNARCQLVAEGANPDSGSPTIYTGKFGATSRSISLLASLTGLPLDTRMISACRRAAMWLELSAQQARPRVSRRCRAARSANCSHPCGRCEGRSLSRPRDL